MKSDYPCLTCIVQSCCSEYCDECIEYYSRLIRSYVKNGEKSYIYKRALNQLPFSILRRIAYRSRFFYTIEIVNEKSRAHLMFDRTGKLLLKVKGQGHTKRF